MSFVGGGSDLPAFYRKFGGAVVSTAIDKYMYITINKKFDSGIRASYSQTEDVENVFDLRHPLIRAAMEMTNIEGGIEMASMADIPSAGTGLGSSSAFTVGMLHALHGYKNQYVSSKLLAEQSCRIEIDICGEPIGKQDQYAAAFGGMNYIRFHPDDTVSVDPLIVSPATAKQLDESTLVFYTGRCRSASNLLARQSKETNDNTKAQDVLKKMVALTTDVKVAIESGDLSTFGSILHENWCLKKSLVAGISDEAIDDWYTSAIEAGAIGGKLLGAGSGGFMMFFAPPERHDAIAHALPGLRRTKFGFDRDGSQIIFYRP
jgi:D-glycero-alpha-D-manno-heptose-7-phosphate kinase